MFFGEFFLLWLKSPLVKIFNDDLVKCIKKPGNFNKNPFGTICQHLTPFRTISEAFETIWEHLGPFGTPFGGYGRFLTLLDTFWRPLEAFGHFWRHLEAFWGFLEAFGCFWRLLDRIVPFRNILDHFGTYFGPKKSKMDQKLENIFGWKRTLYGPYGPWPSSVRPWLTSGG